MRQLFPVTDASLAKNEVSSLQELAEVYAYPEDRLPWLRANMVSSLDGAARFDGLSEGLSSPADKQIFGVLRALADVIVVGAETVRAEGYRPARVREQFAAARAERGQTPAAAIAIVSSRLDLDLSAPLFTSPLVRTVVLTVSDAPAAARRAAEQVADVVPLGTGRVDLAAARTWLAEERGWTRQLTEGGPRLLGQLASLGLVDELCLSVSPLVASGDAPRITNGPVADLRLRLGALLEEDGFLFARYHR